MENPTVSGLRSRSRSKTPFLRSSCDRENCPEGEEHTHHKAGRKTPVKRSTPIKQVGAAASKRSETIAEVEEEQESAPAHRTRHKLATSDYSSEESLDRHNAVNRHTKEIFQNEINQQYERVSTSSARYTSLSDVTLSPIHTAHSVTHDRSRSRIGSPAYSACSTDSSFAEQALADTSLLLERDPDNQHLPSRLYKMAREYWNKYPKTDYTYSPLSKDRVELAPGQVAMPNMSRRSLSQFRLAGPSTSADELDRLSASAASNYTTTTTTLRKRYTSIESSDDESQYVRLSGAHRSAGERWWLTRLILSIITTVTTSTSQAYRKLVGPSHRYPYTDRRPAKANIAVRAAGAAAAPLVWLYALLTTVVTSTVTTITETVTSKHVEERSGKAWAGDTAAPAPRRRWGWLLLAALPLALASHYTYENWDHLAVPNFTDFRLDLSEFGPAMAKISLPNITLPSLDMLPSLRMPDINISLPDIRDNLPEVSRTYYEYKDIVHNRVADASDYVKVVANSCFEEVKRFWRGVLA